MNGETEKKAAKPRCQQSVHCPANGSDSIYGSVTYRVLRTLYRNPSVFADFSSNAKAAARRPLARVAFVLRLNLLQPSLIE